MTSDSATSTTAEVAHETNGKVGDLYLLLLFGALVVAVPCVSVLLCYSLHRRGIYPCPRRPGRVLPEKDTLQTSGGFDGVVPVVGAREDAAAPETADATALPAVLP